MMKALKKIGSTCEAIFEIIVEYWYIWLYILCFCFSFKEICSKDTMDFDENIPVMESIVSTLKEIDLGDDLYNIHINADQTIEAEIAFEYAYNSIPLNIGALNKIDCIGQQLQKINDEALDDKIIVVSDGKIVAYNEDDAWEVNKELLKKIPDIVEQLQTFQCDEIEIIMERNRVILHDVEKKGELTAIWNRGQWNITESYQGIVVDIIISIIIAFIEFVLLLLVVFVLVIILGILLIMFKVFLKILGFIAKPLGGLISEAHDDFFY